MLNRRKNTKLRKAILEYADADLISALCECAHNILRGQLHAANIPMELVGNVARRQHIQKRTRIPTPTQKPKKKKTTRPLQLPDDWESY